MTPSTVACAKKHISAVTVANLADELQMKIDLSTKDLDSGQQMSFQE